MSNHSTTYYRELLTRELARRCKKNPGYSLRAFAKALNVDVGLLSKILSDKLPLTVKTAHKVLKVLNLPQEEKERFLLSVQVAKKERIGKMPT